MSWVQILPINTILKNASPAIAPYPICSNLTNKYNPQEQSAPSGKTEDGSNLTNKYNPQEQLIFK